MLLFVKKKHKQLWTEFMYIWSRSTSPVGLIFTKFERKNTLPKEYLINYMAGNIKKKVTQLYFCYFKVLHDLGVLEVKFS